MFLTMNELSHKSVSAISEIILIISGILELVKYSDGFKNFF